MTTSQPLLTNSRFKRKVLRALLMSRATQRNRSENSEFPANSTDMASAPVIDTHMLEVSEVRVNIRLAPTTDAKIIGEIKK